MFAVICKRENSLGKLVYIPIMESDEQGEPTDSLAKWETSEDAEEFCTNHILCKSSQNIIIDLDAPDCFFFNP